MTNKFVTVIDNALNDINSINRDLLAYASDDDAKAEVYTILTKLNQFKVYLRDLKDRDVYLSGNGATSIALSAAARVRDL